MGRFKRARKVALSYLLHPNLLDVVDENRPLEVVFNSPSSSKFEMKETVNDKNDSEFFLDVQLTGKDLVVPNPFSQSFQVPARAPFRHATAHRTALNILDARIL